MTLRWEDERYIRLFTRDTPSWMLGPWEARAVLGPVLRKLDRAGIVDLGDDGLEALAVVVALPHLVVETGMAWWLKRGTFELVDGCLVMPNFLEAQEANASNAQRSREKRERARDKARAATKRGVGNTKRVATDTKRVASDTTMPSADTPSRAVPPVPLSGGDPQTPLVLDGSTQKDSRGDGLFVVDVFDHWKTVRAKHGQTGTVRLTEKRARLIRDRLKDGYTVPELKHAVDGLFLSDFHSGKNDRNTVYLDLSHALKGEKSVEGFGELARRGRPANAKVDPSRRPPPPLPLPEGTAPNLKVLNGGGSNGR